MAPSTSVVLCTFNGQRFLAAQWHSLLAQTRPPDEIVACDDGSGDDTWALLETLCARAAERGIRVRLRRNTHNLGYVANFEAALARAAGDVLFLCDQDDVWHPEKIATLGAMFEQREGLRLLCSDARRVDAAGTGLPRSLFQVLAVSKAERQRIHAGDGFRVLLRRSLATGATIALRRTLLADALPVPAGWVHDEWLAIIAAALGGFDCTEQALIDYRQHDTNQLGMHQRGAIDKWRGLVAPQATAITAIIARVEVLQRRLQELGTRVSTVDHERAAEQHRHMLARGGLRGPVWRRTGTILRETWSGRYRRCASGWHSALRDLLRGD